MGRLWCVYLVCVASLYATRGPVLVNADLVDDLLEERAGYVRSMRNFMETTYRKFRENETADGIPPSCVGYNACSDKLFEDRCSTDYGNTQGCACAGRSISEGFQVIKESDKVRFTVYTTKFK
jgi:hypothetical protein